MDNFPLLIVFDNSSFNIDNSNSIRFVAGGNSGGTENVTEYAYEIEKWDDSGNCYIWVNVTEVYSGSDTVFNMYYNNSGASDGQDVTGTWNSNYEAVYHMSDDTTSTTLDSTSNNNDGTKTGANAPNEVNGKVGNAQDFDGINDIITIANEANFDTIMDGQHTITISFWANKPSSGRNEYFLNKGDDPNFFGIYTLDTNRLFFEVKAGTNDKKLSVKLQPAITVSTWEHFIFTYDGSSDASGVSLYKNGVLQSLTTSADVLGANVMSNDNAVLFGHTGGWANYLDGMMDEIRISDVVWNDSWVKANFHTQNQTTDFLTFGAEQDKPAGATVPTVTTNDATGVEETNATIRGTLTNNGTFDTTCWFRYGNETPPTDNNDTQGVIANDASFSYNWQSLTPGTLYYFDTQANNSEGWDTTGGIKSFLTKPNVPTGASGSAGEGWTNVSWTGATGADKYLVRYKSGSAPTSVTDGTLFGNVTVLYVNDTAGAGTHYFSIWSYAYESSPPLNHYSDTYDTTSGTETAAPVWYSESFGGSVTVEPTGWSNTAPTVECNSTGSYPANQSTDISLQPTVAAYVNDSDGNQSTVYFYNSTDGSTWTYQQTNTTVLNETVTYQYTEASLYDTKYYWKVSANDTHDNTSAIFEFTTEDLTPNAPASLSAVADSQTQITITWTDQTGADSTRIEQYTSADATWEPNDHDFVYNGSAQTTTNSSLSCGTSYWYKAWSYNTTQCVWSTAAWDNDTTTNNCPTWHSASFGGSVTVGPDFDVELNTTTWVGGSPSCGTSIQKNFTFYQNGSLSLDISITVNSTNLTFVNYTDWTTLEVDEYCANFTIDTWSNESMIEPGYPATTVLKNNHATGSFTFGIRIWMPKGMSQAGVHENFEIIISYTEHVP